MDKHNNSIYSYQASDWLSFARAHCLHIATSREDPERADFMDFIMVWRLSVIGYKTEDCEEVCGRHKDVLSLHYKDDASVPVSAPCVSDVCAAVSVRKSS